MYFIKTRIAQLIILLWVLATTNPMHAQNIRINEVMSSNANFISDEHGSFEDWIEIFNACDEVVNLEGYGLSDNYDVPYKWVFPQYELQPGAFLLVWASGKDLKPTPGEMVNGIQRKYFHGISGTNVDNLLNHPNFPDKPSTQNIITTYFETEANMADNYGQHLYTWIKPPLTGNYTFWISSDDNSRLMLSTDESIENAVQIAEVPGWTNPREWNKYSQQRSASIYLEEGNYYYLSVLMKEGGGGDNLTVRWQWPDNTVEEPISATYCFLPSAGFHTNFSLSAEGEEIILTNPGGELVDEMPPLPIPSNITLGRLPGSGDWFYLDNPTPAAENVGTGFPELAQKPVIYPDGGIYSEPVMVGIQTEEENVYIYYTTNGSYPHPIEENLYTGPFEISNTQYIRALAAGPGKMQGEVAATTFSVADPGLHEFSSNLPLMVIHQFDTIITDGNRTSAFMSVLNNQENSRTHLLGSKEFEGRININLRGSSSLGFPKQGFGFHILEENGRNKKETLFGLPEEHNWILHGPYSDKTLMRNAVAYSLSNDIGQYAPRTQFIELFLHSGNGPLRKEHYHGVYLLVERIKVAPGRIEIEELDTHHNTYPEISGGYIFKKDRLNPGEQGIRTKRSSGYALVRPDEQTITLQQKDYLISYLDSVETTLFGPNFKDPETGYAAYLDVESFIDYHLLTEFCKEIDGYRLSTFFHKDREGKLVLGPIWDYNLSLGNADYAEGWKPDGWYYPLLSSYDYLNGWYTRMFQDVKFAEKYKRRYRSLRLKSFSNQHIIGKVLANKELLSEAQERNFERWNTLGQYVWPNWFIGQTYEEEVLWMIDWIGKRLAWMDTQLGKPYTLIHYWNFNDADNFLEPSYTLTSAELEIIPGPATEITTGSGQDFWGENAREGDSAGLHLRVNNPVGTEIIFKVPTKNFKDVIFSFETRRSGSGANRQYISYTKDGESYLPLDTVAVTELPVLYSYDFVDSTDVNDNLHFAVRILIDQHEDGTGGIAGNNRFDNVTLDGEALEGVNLPPKQIANFPNPAEIIEGGDNLIFNLSTYFTDPDGDELEYIITADNPEIVTITTGAGQLNLLAKQRGGTKINVSVSDGNYNPIHTSFYLLVYPEAARIAENSFTFDYWGLIEPEGSFPQHMIFVQSNQDDPGLEAALNFAYSIPPSDYAAVDEDNIGFPYRNMSRTRINGLESNGISFINTGRGRDLGAAILGLNTQGLDSAYVSWKASTLTSNSRVYNIRLQYRTAYNAPWQNWVDSDGNINEYKRHITGGHSQVFEFLTFPNNLLNQNYIQLRWFYYHTGERISTESGARDMLALNHIVVSDFPVSNHQELFDTNQPLKLFPNPVSHGYIYLNKRSTGYIYDISGAVAGRIDDHDMIDISKFTPGLYLLRNQQGETVKFMVVND